MKTSTFEPGTGHMQYKEVEESLLRSLESGDRRALEGLLQNLDIQGEMLVAAGLHREAVSYSANLDRLMRNLGRARAESDFVAEARGYLRAALDRLDRHVAVLDQQRDVRHRRDVAVMVRERVLELLQAGQLRSGDVAARLGVSQAQASRALNELRRANLVELVGPPPGADRRIRTYAATSRDATRGRRASTAASA